VNQLNPIHILHPHFRKIHFNIIIPPTRGVWVYCSLQALRVRIVAVLISMHDACTAHHILDLIILIAGDGCKWSSSLCSFLQSLCYSLSAAASSHYTPWRRMGERRYSSYSFTTSALDGGEWSASRLGRPLPPVPIGQEAGWAPEPVWTQRLEEKSSCLCRGSNTSCLFGPDTF
jgi:hypothetical protein